MFIERKLAEASRHYGTREELKNEIASIFQEEYQTLIDVSQIFTTDDGDTGGFFIHKDEREESWDVVSLKIRFRFVIVESETGAEIVRYIIASTNSDIGDDYFRSFAYDLVSRIITRSAKIYEKKERNDYIRNALEGNGIYVDQTTLELVSGMVQREFLARYHRMWKM